MNADCIIICLTAATLIVTSLGIWFGWRWHKETKRQSFEQELARIETDIKDIEAQQEDARGRGQAQTQHIYGTNIPNPYAGVIIMLEQKKQNLKDRKAEIIRQLQQL